MNERAQIVTSRATIERSWKSREALLHEVRPHRRSEPVRD